MGKLSRYLLAAEVICLALPITLLFALTCPVILFYAGYSSLDWEIVVFAFQTTLITIFLCSFWILVLKFYLGNPKNFSENNRILWLSVYVAIVFTFFGSALVFSIMYFGQYGNSILNSVGDFMVLSVFGLPVTVPALHMIWLRRQITYDRNVNAKIVTGKQVRGRTTLTI